MFSYGLLLLIHSSEKIYIHQLCADIWCYLEDLPSAMADRDGSWDSVKGICTIGMFCDDADKFTSVFILNIFLSIFKHLAFCDFDEQKVCSIPAGNFAEW